MFPNFKWLDLKKIKLILFLFTLILCIGYESNKRISKLFEKANNFYDENNYVQALKLYDKINSRTGFDEKACLQAARCSRFLEKYTISDHYYTQLFYKSKQVEPILFLEYGELLMKLGRQNEARSYFTSYNNLMESNDLSVLRYIESIENYDKFFIDSSFVDISRITASTDGDDLNPVIYSGKLFFESNFSYLKSSPAQKDLYSLDLYNNNIKDIKKLIGSSASKTEMAGFTIAYETGEIVHSIRSELHDQNFTLYRAFIEDNGNKVSKAEPISIETFDGNACYPAISNNGKILIFASDFEPERGWDLYFTNRSAYGYSEPQRIQGFINTLGHERNPYLLNDSILIFASNGQGGLGGFDLYYANLNQPSNLPKNLGFPLNSNCDEFGFVLDNNRLSGFLVSNREQQNTFSDLYLFKFRKIRAWGEVTDQQTGENLKNVAINITRKGEENSQFTLADNGWFEITGNPGDEYQISVWREGYSMEDFSINIPAAGLTGLYEVELGRFPMEKRDQTAIIPSIDEKTITQEVIEINETPEEELLPEKKPQIQDKEKVFRIQIAASRKPLSDSEIKAKYPGNFEVFVFKVDNWYKYAIGEYSSFYEADQARKKCGIKDAFIAAYREENKIELIKAIK